jgi:hypothetical protein
VHANYAPSFLAKAESRKFLRILSGVCGVGDIEEFRVKLSERFNDFVRFFRGRGAVYYDGFYVDTKRFGAID